MPHNVATTKTAQREYLAKKFEQLQRLPASSRARILSDENDWQRPLLQILELGLNPPKDARGVKDWLDRATTYEN